ncbi:protein nlrc3 [Chrysochromulina tobinii]|uniref:Protein nlrc3 n=1 Tax=Chrysochromulina tobinii TaxID=1460289 RepID=A0A0M0J442_9EUKA|nr:protein nlrc3 [Chrysochromulina tobinii]|eukprot:KOO21250.1 protein nlrc3 [Chrysochromulina sp. CCMP291]
MTDGQERVRLRAREGEAVEWTRRVAQQAGTLKDMMDDAPTEDGVYPVPMIAAAELAVLREMCEADSMPARLEQCSISELFRLVEGASFLDAPRALNHAQCALGTRLNGKCANELRELLGATEGFGNADERVAALAEPAFSPEGQLSEATVGSAGGAPALLQPQPSLSGMAVTDDAKEVALGMVDVGTLVELKGVSQSWLALARRVLCSRLSRCEGQPAPTQMAEITDLNIKVLVDAGRPWEAAAAGRMLPNLARLRWEGFEVSVAAVREVDLDERDEDEDEEEGLFFGGPAERPRRAWKLLGSYTALLSCIEGEGEPPLELLLAAVACAGSGEIRGIPVQMMRDDSVSELDLQKINIGVEGGMLLAHLVPVMGRLTVANLLGNQLDAESAKILAEVAKQKGISLCGIQRDQTTADFSNQDLKPPDAILLGSDLSQAVVTDGLTSINLSGNQMCGIWTVWSNQLGTYTAEGITAIADALRVNGALTSVKLRGNELGDEGWGAIFAAICANKDSKIMSLDASGENIGLAGGKLIAKALCTSVTGTLTSFNLRGNKLGEEGWGAIFAAICGSKDSKIMSLDASGENIGLAGGKLIAKALRTSVTGGLTALNLSLNSLKDEGVSAVCKAIQSNKETKIASLNFEDNGIVGPVGANAVAAMVAVTGALTSVKLRGNELGDEGWGAIFAAICGSKDSKIMSLDASGENIGLAGGKLIAKALRTSVTGGLTALNLSLNSLKDEGVSAVCKAIQSNKETKIASLNFGSNCIGPVGANAVAAMVAVTGALKSINLSGNQLCGIWTGWRGQQHGTYTAEGVTAIADALRVNGALTKLSLAHNNLGEEGTKAICEALEQNTTLKELDIRDSDIGGSAGAKHVAKMVGVNGALTNVELRRNHLGDKGWGAIFAAICGNKDSKIMSLDAAAESIGPAGVKLIAEALRSSVTGALTQVLAF